MDFFSNHIFFIKSRSDRFKVFNSNNLRSSFAQKFLDNLDDQGMDQANLDDFMENDLANMAERDAEVELVMAEYDAGDQGGDAGYDVND